MMQYLISMQLTAGDFLFGLLCLIIIGLIIFFNTAKGKGILGEWKVRIQLRMTLGKKVVIINNFIGVDEDYQNVRDASLEKTIQIDHVVVGAFGVLIIETKNLAGEIYGHFSNVYWTQVLKNGEVKNKIYNPIKQNSRHYHFVKKIVGDSVPIRSIVVFVQDNTDHILCNGEVVNLSSLKKYLRNLPNALLTKEEIAEIADKLQSVDQSDTISNRQHTKNLKKVSKSYEAGLCPYCGGKLVRRKSEYGFFIGCSNYPKCNFKKNL